MHKPDIASSSFVPLYFPPHKYSAYITPVWHLWEKGQTNLHFVTLHPCTEARPERSVCRWLLPSYNDGATTDSNTQCISQNRGCVSLKSSHNHTFQSNSAAYTQNQLSRAIKAPKFNSFKPIVNSSLIHRLHCAFQSGKWDQDIPLSSGQDPSHLIQSWERVSLPSSYNLHQSDKIFCFRMESCNSVFSLLETTRKM